MPYYTPGHDNSDVDTGNEAQHHTLGTKAGQAMPGNSSSVFITGELKMTPVATVPDGWLLCDGSAVSRTTFVNLFKTIGTTFGSGDGSTTFNLPDFRGRFPIGFNSGQTVAGTLGGNEGQASVGARSNAQQHTHDHTTPNHTHTDNFTVTGTSLNQVSNTAATGAATRLTAPDTHIHTLAGGVTSSGSSTTGSDNGLVNPNVDVHAYLAINFLIKT